MDNARALSRDQSIVPKTPQPSVAARSRINFGRGSFIGFPPELKQRTWNDAGCLYRYNAQIPPCHRTHLRTAQRVCRTVVLATHTPLTRVLPAPHAKATCVIMCFSSLRNPTHMDGRVLVSGRPPMGHPCCADCSELDLDQRRRSSGKSPSGEGRRIVALPVTGVRGFGPPGA